MVDHFSKSQRSALMARIRGRGNVATELALVSLLRRNRIVGWRRHIKAFGNPDFVFRSERVAIFVDGCFWHGCQKHGRIPTSNRKFWSLKLERNTTRDRAVNRELRIRGWQVLRIWQHELMRGREAQCVRRIRHALLRDL